MIDATRDLLPGWASLIVFIIALLFFWVVASLIEVEAYYRKPKYPAYGPVAMILGQPFRPMAPHDYIGVPDAPPGSFISDGGKCILVACPVEVNDDPTGPRSVVFNEIHQIDEDGTEWIWRLARRV